MCADVRRYARIVAAETDLCHFDCGRAVGVASAKLWVDTGRAMGSEPADKAGLIRRWVAAFDARDMTTLGDLIEPDFEFHPFLAALMERSVYRGLDGMRRCGVESDAAWETLEGRVDEVDEVDDRHTIACGELHGKGRASGMEVHVPMALLAEWRADKLVRLETHQSKQQALEAVGQEE